MLPYPLFSRLFLAAALLAAALGVCGCGGTPPPSSDIPEAPIIYEVFRTLPEGRPRPEWSLVPPGDKDGQMFFCGVSNYHATEQEVREAALQHARSQFAQYTGVDFQAISQELSVSYNLASEIEDPTMSSIRKQKEEVNAQFGRLRPIDWYLEQSHQKRGKVILAQAWQAWGLVSVPTDEYNQVVAWRERMEADARQQAEEILSDSLKHKEETRAMLAAGRPLDALGKIEGNWKVLGDRREKLKDYGWPYNNPRYALQIDQAQSILVEQIRDVRAAIILDTGRYNGSVCLPPRRTETTVAVWAFCEADGDRKPIPSFPLALREESGATVARAVTGFSGKAEFRAAGLRAGAYTVALDTEAPPIRDMDDGIRRALSSKENRLAVLTPGETLPEVIQVAIRNIFQGPAVCPPPASTVSLGPVTFVNPSQQDTRQGGDFSRLLKDKIRNEITQLEGLRVVEPQTRSAQAFEQAARTRDLLNRGAPVTATPPMGSAAGQALLDNAEGALESRYTVYGADVQLAMELKKAGTDEILASSLVTIPAGSIPPGMVLRPPQLPVYQPQTLAPAGPPIRIEVTSHRGDGETYTEGEDMVYFFSTDRDAYLLLIYEDAEGDLLQVLPNSYSGQAFYSASKYFQIPESSANYTFTITGPFGPERLWAFASSARFPELQGTQYTTGKALSQPMASILAILRRHGAQPGVAYGEAQTILTTVSKSGDTPLLQTRPR